jgi:hypothetical protein
MYKIKELLINFKIKINFFKDLSSLNNLLLFFERICKSFELKI